jgi:hypothetical protein
MSLERDMEDWYDPAGFYDDEYRYVPTIGAQENVFDPTYGKQYSDPYANYTPDSSGLAGLFSAALGGAKTLGTSLLTTPRGIATLLAMIYGARNTRPDSGGINLNLSPSKVTRTIVPGKYGPVAKTSFAADGGLMQAYAAGGMVTGTPQRPLPMEDGGFVMTKKAVDGAGGPQGLAQMLPGAKMIHGPGDGSGRDDRVHARIGNTTPARVSSGEAYVPKAVVDEAGGAKTLYAMMNRLQRSA